MNRQPPSSTDARTKIVNGLLLVGGVFVTYTLGKKLLDQLHKTNTQNAADDSPAVRQAMTLRSGMNPSGITWLMSADGTDEAIILDTAKTITNLDEVSKAYINLYRDNLLDDLQKELSSDDYQKFLTLVSSNGTKQGGTLPVAFAAPSSLIVAKTDVFLRTSPDASNHGAIYEVNSKNNIIRKATPGEFLGYATGKQQFDAKNNVKFIEVGYVINGEKAPADKKSQNKKKVVFWVSSSVNYIDSFKFFKDLFEKYPASVSATSWMKPLDFFSAKPGVKGIPTMRLIARSSVIIMDDQFNSIALVDEGTLLGNLIMTIDSGEVRLYQFQTVDNTRRWVNANFIQLQEYDR